VFHEILGFNPSDPAGMVRDAWKRLNELVADLPGRSANQLRALVAHAPYSTAPALFAEIAAQHAGPAPLSVHLAESTEEIEFLHTGRGPIRQMLETLGVWDGTWEVPRCGPVEYLRRVGYLQPGTLLVHCVHLTAAELDQARDAEAVIVTCPRSNVWVGAGVPPVSRFYGSGVPVAIGTDSLASTGSLNMFDELAALRRLAPEVDAARLLDSATRVGADALGFGKHYGSIGAGRLAVFASVALPPGIGARSEDVEEYLVSGVSAAAVSTLNH
jgi:cytosine/adenosine deaminase-related metal-dependent hydrolase